MVSATFGEKINTDRIVMDKTAAEAIAEQYPEALAKNPGFLGTYPTAYCMYKAVCRTQKLDFLG